MSVGGQLSVFASLPRTVSGCPGGVGLTTAMVQLKTGWVIVGSLPSANGLIGTAGAGCLLVLSSEGKLVSTIAGSYLDGPWDATVKDDGSTAELFVANTLIGITGNSSDTTDVDKGDVVRLTLYVANNLDNAVDAVPGALTRADAAGTCTVLTSGGQLANPLGLALAPDGNFLGYQQDPRKAFVPVFTKLAEADALNQFTTHTASAVFAVPPGAAGPGDWVGNTLLG